eukprot:tig00021072_g17970.t1
MAIVASRDSPCVTSRSLADLPDEIVRSIVAKLGPKCAKVTLGSTCRAYRTLVAEEDAAWRALCKDECGILIPEGAPRGTAHMVFFGFGATRCRVCHYGNQVSYGSPYALRDREPPVVDPLTNWLLCPACARCDITADQVLPWESKSMNNRYGLYGDTVPHILTDGRGLTNRGVGMKERKRRQGLPAGPECVSFAEIVKRFRLNPRRYQQHRPRGSLSVAGYDPMTLEERFDLAAARRWLVDTVGIRFPEARVEKLELATERRKRKHAEEQEP